MPITGRWEGLPVGGIFFFLGRMFLNGGGRKMYMELKQNIVNYTYRRK
jgi:hypothetical protein